MCAYRELLLEIHRREIWNRSTSFGVGVQSQKKARLKKTFSYEMYDRPSTYRALRRGEDSFFSLRGTDL